MTFLSFSGWKPCFSADHKQFIADNWSVIGCYFMPWNKLQGLSVSFSTIDQMQRSMSWLVFYNRHLMTWGQNDLNDLGVKWLRANRLGGKTSCIPYIDTVCKHGNMPGLEFYHGNCHRGNKMLWFIAATTAIFCCIVQFSYYSLCITIFWYLNSDVDQIMRKLLF